MSKVKNLFAKMLQRFGRGSNGHGSNDSQRYDSLEEIAQNQANERMLMQTLMGYEEEPLVICLETAAGSFYWHSQ